MSEGSQLSDGEDEDIPDDDPEREEEARAVYSRELREGDATTAKEAAEQVRSELRTGGAAIIFAYPHDAELAEEDVRLRRHIGARVQIALAPVENLALVMIRAPEQDEPGGQKGWITSRSRLKRVVGVRGTPLEVTGRVPAPGDEDQTWRPQALAPRCQPPPRAARAIDHR